MDAINRRYGFSVVNVGQGSLQVLDGPGDVCIVFDCNLAGAPEYVCRYLGRRKIKKISLLVITGTDTDHADADGLRMLAARYEIERVWIPDFPKDTDNWKEFRRALRELEKGGTKVEKPTAGDETTVDGVHLKALGPHPEDSTTSNNASLVVKVTVGKVGFLVPGDCENERWESILRYFGKWLPSEVMVGPHHGSDHGCVEDVVKSVDPLYTAISVGEGNKYGHPDKKALAIYRRLTRKDVFLTKDDGSILFESDGNTITSVVTNAGQHPDGVKEEERRVAQALAGIGSLCITSSGAPSIAPASGIAYRPTHFHGGARADDAKEAGLAVATPEEVDNQLSDVERAFDLVERISTPAAFELHPPLRSAFQEGQIRAAFLVSLNTLWDRAYRILFVVPVWYPQTPPAAYCLDIIKGQYRVQHMFVADWRICFHHPAGGDWSPRECSLATAVGWAAMWLFCQEYLQRYSRWPAPVGAAEPVLKRSARPWPSRRR